MSPPPNDALSIVPLTTADSHRAERTPSATRLGSDQPIIRARVRAGPSHVSRSRASPTQARAEPAPRLAANLVHLLALRAHFFSKPRQSPAFPPASSIADLAPVHSLATPASSAKLRDPSGRSGGFALKSVAFVRPVFRSTSGRGAAWLARLNGVQEVASSNLAGPTYVTPCRVERCGRALLFPDRADPGLVHA